MGVPCGPINTIDKVVNHPQVLAREMIAKVSHEITGSVEVPGVPIKLSETPGQITAPAPALGEHTEKILTGLLGKSPETVDRLEREGVV